MISFVAIDEAFQYFCDENHGLFGLETLKYNKIVAVFLVLYDYKIFIDLHIKQEQHLVLRQ